MLETMSQYISETPKICKANIKNSVALTRSVVDAYDFYRHKPNAYILTKVNVLGFFELFLSTILNKSPEELLRLSALLKEDSHD